MRAECVVRAAVVNNNELPVAECLGKNALHGIFKMTGPLKVGMIIEISGLQLNLMVLWI